MPNPHIELALIICNQGEDRQADYSIGEQGQRDNPSNECIRGIAETSFAEVY
jgi:hypothetical protein